MVPVASSTIATAAPPEPTSSAMSRVVESLEPCTAVLTTMAPSVQALGGDAGAEIVVAVPPVTVSETSPATPPFQPSLVS